MALWLQHPLFTDVAGDMFFTDTRGVLFLTLGQDII